MLGSDLEMERVHLFIEFWLDFIVLDFLIF